MKRRAFLSNIAKLKGQFEFTYGRLIRTKKTYLCVFNHIEYPKTLCPIEALCIKNDKVNFLDDCIVELKLDEELQDLIIEAVDHPYPNNKKACRLRKRIIELLGL